MGKEMSFSCAGVSSTEVGLEIYHIALPMPMSISFPSLGPKKRSLLNRTAHDRLPKSSRDLKTA